LTKKGRQQVLKAVKKLKNKHIDLIYASDLTRTKETAEIVGKELGVKVQYEKLLREFDAGEFNGKKFEEFIQFFRKKGENSMEHYLERFIKRAPGGENWMDVQRRNHKLMQRLEKKHKGKNILLVGHEAPFTLLQTQLAGMSREEIIQFRSKGKIKTGELRKVSFADFPVNENMEIDLHRPYVDKVKFACLKCKQGVMERIKEVVDVWFDSGAMPFAQYHYPFENKKLIDKKEQFPADYISEAIDQTRGWFYTLVAVSTLLGKGTPYKNVISLGHILDEKGEKMSKSKGNIVDPWEMIGTYGIDAIRWYFFTASSPGDPKLFSEKDLQQATRNFLLPLWNSYVFYKMYSLNSKSKILNSKHILDKWILSRLTTVTQELTARVDMYDVTGAARALENFVVQDLSLWYIRRSRARFQNPQTKIELREATATLGHVLLEISKLAAPFVPFMAEHIYKELQKGKEESVHLEDWVSVEKKNVNKKLEDSMAAVREIAAKGLAERAKAGIRVRQPLAAIKIQNDPTGSFRQTKSKIQNELLNLVKDELNVKEVVIRKGMKKNVELDTRITGALRREGMVREILRHIQDMRKKAGYQPKHRVRLRYSGNKELEEIIRQNAESITKSVGIKEFITGDKPKQVFDIEQEFEVEGHKLWLGIRKI
ncbi:class I tRNA ligase family protein, partial [Patescibacteria group bacterium]|nr:class I tRNA ligase family protein [Patescibacteria group bacterium]